MEAYIIDSTVGQIGTGRPRASLVRDVLQDLFTKTGAPARRLQEIHWMEASANLLEPGLLGQSRDLQLPDSLVAFQWPVTPLLAHYAVQAVARSIEDGERDLVAVCQFGQSGRLWQDHLVALMLASPQAVGRYNLAPRARLGRRQSLNGRWEGAAGEMRALLEPQPPGVDNDSATAPAPQAAPVRWLASACPITNLPVKEMFPEAQWLDSSQTVVSGDLFLLDALVNRLQEQPGGRGVWISEGPQMVRLATLVEQI